MATKTTTTKSTKSRKTTAKTKVAEVATPEMVESKDDAVNQMKAATKAMEKMANAAVEAIAKTEENIKKTKDGYAEDDLIMCKSITEGTLIHIGKKSGTKYIWSGFGDTTEVEVQDLNSLRASRSQYLFKPLIMIEDEEFVSQDKWKDVKKMYDKIQADDIDEILNLGNADFENVLRNLPAGLQEAVKGAVSAAILNDTFDSLQKVKIVDSVLGSDLKSLLK